MSDSVEIEKARLSPEVINTICEAHPKNVRLKKVVASEALLLKGKVFSDIEIASSNCDCCRIPASTIFFIDE